MAVILVGVAKAGFGGGAGVLGTPLMALTIPVAEAVALMLPLLIVCDIFSVWHYRTRFHRRSVGLLLAGSVLGVGAGTVFFGVFIGNQRVLELGVGTLALLFVAFRIGRGYISGKLEARRPSAAEGVLMGAASGFGSTLAHAGGPPAAMYVLPQKLPRDLFVGTTVTFFAGLNLIKVAPYYGLGLWKTGDVWTILMLAPLSFLGVRLGIVLIRRFTDAWFTRAIYALLLATGLKLVLHG